MEESLKNNPRVDDDHQSYIIATTYTKNGVQQLFDETGFEVINKESFDQPLSSTTDQKKGIDCFVTIVQPKFSQ